MKKPDLIKQLANRINQPHVIESWINKIEKAAYKKGYEDAQNEQCNIANVVVPKGTFYCLDRNIKGSLHACKQQCGSCKRQQDSWQ